MVAVATALALAVTVTRLLGPSSPIDTDIMALLPQDDRDPVLAASIGQAATLVGSRVAFLVHHPNPTSQASAAADLRAALEATGLFVAAEDEAAALGRYLFANRAELLCPEDRTLLEGGGGAVLAQKALAQIYAPLMPIPGDLLRADPLLLTMRLAACLDPGSGRAEDGILVSGRLTVSPYGFDAQEKIEDAIARWRATDRAAGALLSRSGALFHGAAAAARARSEIAWVSGFVVLGVLSLFWTLFGNLRAALLALTTMAVGTLGGLGACLALFTHVHALAVLFGAAMSGISVDYAIHVMVAGLRAQDGNPAARVARPLLVSMATTLAGFACLALSGVAVMQQIAVFGGAAIVFAYGFCRFVLGSWYRPPARSRRPAQAVAAAARALLGWEARPAVLAAVTIVALLLAALGYSRLVGSDDVRTFQPVPTDLAAEEQSVAAATGYRIDPSFVLVRATGLEALREREAVAVEGLAQQLPAPAWLDPGATQRLSDRTLIEQQLLSAELDRIAVLLDLDAATLYPQAPSDTALPEALAAMRGRAGDTDFSIVPLLAGDTQRVEAADGIEWVDPGAVYTALLERFRQLARQALVLALAACAVGVLLISHRPARLCLLLPAALAIGLVPAIAGLTGQTFSLFSVMGLFVALGLSIDFAAFQAIGRDQDREPGWREAGILVAAISTIVPMTLLSFSETLPVRHFAYSVALGTALGLILSPLARWSWSQRETSEMR